MIAVPRVWAPFAIGFALGVGVVGFLFYDALVRRPPSLQQPWEHEGLIETYIARWKHYDWRYSVFVATPIVMGTVTWGIWFVLSLAAGVVRL